MAEPARRGGGTKFTGGPPAPRVRIAVDTDFVRAAAELEAKRSREAVRLYRAGCSMLAVARALNMPQEAVRTELIRAGIVIRSQGRRSLSTPVLIPVVGGAS